MACIVFVFCAAAIAAPAQTLTTLYSFCAQINCPDGMTPYAPVVQATDGNFYGTTSVGGAHQIGTVFQITPAGALTTLHSFGSGGDGSVPYGGVVEGSDGNFYGTTQAQGTSGRGTVFNITSAGVLTTIHNFNGADGSNAYGQLVQGSDGNFYGTTSTGGTANGGTVFKITPSETLTTLYSFCQQLACADGLSPYAGLVAGTDGNFYGTTLGGGAQGSNGTVFKITPSGVLTTLHSFDNSDGAFPYSPLVQGSDGNFYGTVSGGGPQNSGAIFKITPAGDFTTLHFFVPGSDGYGPKGGLVQASDGNFYGLTSADTGTIFKITPGGSFTVLFRFNFSDGGFPYSGMIQATDGNLYGTTSSGGQYSEGTVFRFSLGPITYSLTVSVSGNGTVTSTDGFINCPGTCSHSYPPGAPVTLNASPAQGWSFAGWSGACTGTGLCNLVMNQSLSVTAAFRSGSSVLIDSSPNPSTFGDVVTITATVSPAGPPAPTGTVSFTSNATAISGCTAVPLTSSLTAVCMTSTLAVGTDAIVATYSGDTNYSGSSGGLSQLVNPTPSPLQFVAVTPCRLVDTRRTGGPIQGGSSRSFPVLQEGGCNIPSDAAAYSLNVTVVPHGPLGYLTIWPTGEGQPVVSTMNSVDGRVKADAAIVPAGSSGEVSVYVTNTTDVILDIDGYFAPVSGSTYAFYPLPPCRVADTRKSDFPQGLGPPQLFALTPRDFPVLNSTCIPSGVSPTAYSFNFTVVPGGHSVGYLSVWPTGQSQPVVSTLNDQTGTIVANAAIVPAGTGGDISVYSTDDTQLVIDINGYFAPAGTGGLSLYAVAPCRVIDTRHVGSGQPFSGTLTPPVDVVDSPCGPPATALAYVFNATVVPQGGLGYLTLWPDGTDQPVVSTLNAFDGALTNNMAIVPTNNGKVDAFANGLTQLILDISSYFAP
jgi:uncharacterized repeat protein (TIGR03803 family)